MSSKQHSITELRRLLLDELLDIFPGNEASSISRIIFDHYGFEPNNIIKNPSQLVSYKIHSEIKKIVRDLGKNKPIQYILGETYFFDLTIKVNEHVLIPRSETEELVQNILLENKVQQPRILDIGTGSGCIAISLACNIPESRVFALDVDENSILLAKENAKANNVNIEFLHKSIFEIDPNRDNNTFDIIVSNPPYVMPSEKIFMERKVLDFEPSLALFTPEEDPLIFFKKIIQYSNSKLSPSGSVWVEINEKFGVETKKLFLASAFSKVRVMKDIHGKDRFIKAMR
jgi:release factor glutamine methyltransferase